MEFTKEITAYSGSRYSKYKFNATIRKKRKLVRDDNGFEEVDYLLIRIFDLKAKSLKIGDIIVIGNSNEVVTTNPITTLSKKFGKDNVVKIKTVTENIYNTKLDHIKLECL
jgi:superfamily I DNA and RNA helicase